MIDSFYIGATGLNANQAVIDTVSNHIANIKTAGFNKTRLLFSDLYASKSEGSANAAGQGRGAGLVDSLTIFSQGEIRETGRALDIAIEGTGFFEVELPDGSLAYTRDGFFQISDSGLLQTRNGYQLTDGIRIPFDAQGITVSKDGIMSVSLPNESDPLEVGQFELHTFQNPENLRPIGDLLYRPDVASGDAVGGIPTEENLGALRQFALEFPDIDIAGETVDLLIAQRAFSVSASILSSSNQLMAVIEQLDNA